MSALNPDSQKLFYSSPPSPCSTLPPPPVPPANLPPIPEHLLRPTARLRLSYDSGLIGHHAPPPHADVDDEFLLFGRAIIPRPRTARYTFTQHLMTLERVRSGCRIVTHDLFAKLSSHLHRVRAGSIHLYVSNDVCSIVLNDSDFSLPSPLFQTMLNVSPYVAALAYGNSIELPIGAGRLLLGQGLEVFLINFSPQVLRRVRVLVTLRSCPEAFVRPFFEHVRPGGQLKDEDVVSSFEQDFEKAKEGLVVLFSQEPDCSWTVNENWDSTVQEDVKTFLHNVTGGNIGAMSAMVGHSVTVGHENGILELGNWQGLWLVKFSPGFNDASRMIVATYPRRTERRRTYYHKRSMKIGTLGRRFTFLKDSITEKKWNAWFEKVDEGLAHFFLRHTTATVMVVTLAHVEVIMEHIDKLVPREQDYFKHTYDGPDDIAGHIKVAMFGAHLTIPIRRGHLAIGEDQFVVISEFRGTTARSRDLTVVIEGTHPICEVEHESDLDGDEAMWGLNWDKSLNHRQFDDL